MSSSSPIVGARWLAALDVGIHARAYILIGAENKKALHMCRAIWMPKHRLRAYDIDTVILACLKELDCSIRSYSCREYRSTVASEDFQPTGHVFRVVLPGAA